MTVLDVLRYYITDIYNTDDLDSLPEALFVDWIVKCADKDRGRVLRACSANDVKRHVIVKAMVLSKIALVKGRRQSYNHTGWEELYKEKFLIKLREMIAEYEPI